MTFAKQTLLITTISAAVLLAGCATTGNERLEAASQASVQAQIQQGKTTKQEVQDAFGSPNKTTFTDSGLEIWTYELAHATPHAINFVPIVGAFVHGADVRKKTLTVLFDDNGTVKKYTFAETTDVAKGGIGQ
ncbi:outer membrane protein assembly factor BamE domain-containing protein [Burkholderia glumae]|uniref:outer membrane protein assembly factor BamE domain-containing protein n=1 Tax=Burkholderia glumae TaxID=337 RepID=UPI0013741B50|nr:outer membrane protein assembly factor BamE [Burkholderia glumae]MCM2541805.1 outer membrane protein assembly factor BamE [Burkholderia glumae]MCR1770707.1 outer membrane protein assembly factor BamE [Burkholderia glumae]QHP94971.1 outer membrane protein assembly factor BamE [Burkholderia glumae]UVS88691.1 outer membrane protein assembly factor BamE [Burkholderia glumae]